MVSSSRGRGGRPCDKLINFLTVAALNARPPLGVMRRFGAYQIWTSGPELKGCCHEGMVQGAYALTRSVVIFASIVSAQIAMN